MVDVGWIAHSVHDPLPTGDPNAPALSIDGLCSWSYGELAETSEAYARGLSAEGVVQGDRVGILLLNSLEYFALYFAIGKLGAIAVRLNWRMAPAELEYVISDSGCKVVCFHTPLAEKIEPIRGTLPTEVFVAFEPAWTDKSVPTWAKPSRHLSRPAPPTVDVTIGLDDVVMLMYTSGTTGRPKGVMWTHANTLWHASIQSMKFGFGPDNVALTTGPFYHAGAFEVFLLPALLRRGTAVGLASGGFSIDRLIDVIERMRVTDALLYPFMLYDLLRHPRSSREGLASLCRIKCGGDVIMPWAIEELTRRLPNVELVLTYGLTEGGGNATYLDSEDLMEHRTTVGRPLPLTRVRVVKRDGSAAAVGEVGEVVLSSPAVSPGYWRRPEETAATFVNDWCRSGDLGTISPDGYLTITGRLKDMIRTGGENVYPAEVEAVLTSHPAVYDAALVAVPDEKFVETGCAVMVIEQGMAVTDEELRGYCRGRLAAYKCPRYWVRVAALPRNQAGKVLKYQLRDMCRDIPATHD